MAIYRVTKGNSRDDAVTYETDEYPALDTPFVCVELLVAIDGRKLLAAIEEANDAK